MRKGNSENKVKRAGEFFSKLSSAALKDFSLMEHPASYAANVVLFAEREPVPGIFVILEGEVRLSINSTDGKRLSLRIARAGDIIGLSSALSGAPSDMTADTVYPTKVAVIERPEFLSFLTRNPGAYQSVVEELGRQVSNACSQLRTVGLSASAPEKLARLLLEWSDRGQTTDSGSHLRLSLTHEEIGDFIGTSRETVTRTLTNFKNRHLVALKGSMITIPSRAALAEYVHERPRVLSSN